MEGGKSGGQRIGRGWISIARAIRVLDLSARLINAHPTKVLVDYVLRIIPFLYFSSALIASIESVQSGARCPAYGVWR